MVLQSTGQISLSNIAIEFGGNAPYAMSQYYTGGAFVPASTTGILTSSTISISHFYGKTKQVGLYPFTSHTFTNAGSTGNLGPWLSQYRSAYSNVSWAQDTVNKYLDMAIGPFSGIQLWKVPITGTYRITCAGASGGSNTNTAPGKGAVFTGNLILTSNQSLQIVVGQMGGNGSQGGGGGGSFVVTTTSSILCASGGGGGCEDGPGANYGSSNKHASLVTTAKAGINASDMANAGTGGTLFNGGGVSSLYPTASAAGGAGYSGNGANSGTNALGGNSFTNGAKGGTVGQGSGGVGGFGGGGAGEYFNMTGGGGGGGVSGGGGGTFFGCGGGGGSFHAGTSVTSSATNVGHGYVTITFLG